MSYPQFPWHITGYGNVNRWMDLDPDQYVYTVASAGCNAVHQEFLGFGNSGYYQNWQPLRQKAKKLMAACGRGKIACGFVIVNWNTGGGGVSQNGKVSICNPAFSNAWFEDIMKFMAGEIGPANTWLTICSELGGRNAACTTKGRQWLEIAERYWPITKGAWLFYNGKPAMRPGWFAEPHPSSTKDLGRQGQVICTDHSKILTEFNGKVSGPVKNHKKLYDYVSKVKKGNLKGFVFYGFDVPGIDVKGIQAVGKAAPK